MGVRGLWRIAVTAAVVGLIASLSAVSSAMPIPGKLLCIGTVVYFMEGDTDNITPAPAGLFYNGDISPSGTAVAYMVGVTDTLKDVWKADIDGSNQVNLTAIAGFTGVNCFPRWSPDGSRIAFQHSEPVTGQKACDAGFHLWIMNSDGTGAYPLKSPSVGLTTYPVWMSNGGRLLCESSAGIIFINTDGTDVQILPNVGATPALSPDGSKIVSSTTEYSTADQGNWRRLVVTNADGSNPQVLVERFISDADVIAHLTHLGLPTDAGTMAGMVGNIGPVEPQWAPTGGLIVFSAAIPLDVLGPNYDLQREVWMYDFSTAQATQITTNTWSDSGFSWHGDNTYADHPSVTVDNTTVTFSEVSAPGLTTIIADSAPPQLPSGYQPAGAFYQISTSAGVTGPTEVVMTYQDGALPVGLPEGELFILHYNDAGYWEDVTSSRDPDGNVLSGSTTSLSAFGMGGFVPHHFSDVLPGGFGAHGVDPFWAYSAIEACLAAGIVQGYSDGTYQPSDPVTRDQMAVYISRALAGGDAAVPVGPSTATFSDVATDYWAFKYVEYAVSKGVVKGYSDGTYKPTDEVTRDQMSVFVARAIATPTAGADLVNYTPPATATFPDVPTTFWAYKYVEYIAQPSIAVTKGYPDGDYHPEYVCTRDQMAVYVARAFSLQ
jgi:hypothetical protein